MKETPINKMSRRHAEILSGMPEEPGDAFTLPECMEDDLFADDPLGNLIRQLAQEIARDQQ